ncbi:MAG: SAM-dependent chlorinase/fluorinase [Armatimonadetes bacterium]|nr:SAM-dependent chlorinase/fluorinase [Armatimonadota bacterium]
MNRIITLTTDFSMSDAYVGMMKGAILSVSPDITIVDLAHNINAHDVFEAAFVLQTAYRFFPEGTVHVVVVDPGVGSVRRRLAMCCGNHYFVGPDNGVFSYVIRDSDQCSAVEIVPTNSRSGLHGVTFEGRDVFAPAAAKLASGVPLSEIGKPADNLVLLDIPRPRVNDVTIDGKIIYIDHFGNCVSNIEAVEIEKLGGSILVSVGGQNVGPLRTSYSDVPVGEPLAIINSLDHLEIAINQGNAEIDLNVKVGTPVKVTKV